MNKITTKDGLRINPNQIKMYSPNAETGGVVLFFDMNVNNFVTLNETVEEFDQLIDLKDKTDLEKAFYHMVNQNPIKLSEEGLTEYENILYESDQFKIINVSLDRLKVLDVKENLNYFFKLNFLEL